MTDFFLKTLADRPAQNLLFVCLLILLNFPIQAQRSQFVFPETPEHQLLDWKLCRKFWTPEGEPDRKLLTRCETLQLFGDGRAVSSLWDLGDEPLMSRQQLHDLLRSLEPLVLQAEDLTKREAETSFLRLHLDHYATSDPDYRPRWLVDVRLVDDDIPEAVREELINIHSWLRKVYRLERLQLPLFVSRNPHPRICQPDHRREVGLGVLAPIWCKGKIAPDVSEAEQEATRQKLRDRLRQLPRGLHPASESKPEEQEDRLP